MCVVNVLPDTIDAMDDDVVSSISEMFTEEWDAGQAAYLRDEVVYEPEEVDQRWQQEAIWRDQSTSKKGSCVPQ